MCLISKLFLPLLVKEGQAEASNVGCAGESLGKSSSKRWGYLLGVQEGGVQGCWLLFKERQGWVDRLMQPGG